MFASPTVTASLEKSIPPVTVPIRGIRILSTSEETILPNAAPIITPTAISNTLPRIAKSLNSFKILLILKFLFKLILKTSTNIETFL